MTSLHLTNAWHGASGGIRTFYLELIKRAPARNHRFCIVAPSDRDGAEEINPHARVYLVRSGKAPFNSAYRMLAPQSYLGPRSPIVRILNAEQPDLVEICDKYSLPYLGGLIRHGCLPGYRGRPAVAALSCERLDDNVQAYLGAGQWARTVTPVLLKWLYFPMADHHIAVSGYTAEELAGASRGHSVRRGVWLGPMGVDLVSFSPTLRTRRFGEDGRLELVYAGRLAPEKNAGLLLDAAEALGTEIRWRLTIAGDGILRPALERRAARLPQGAVRFLGHLGGRAELARLLANSDVFLHPNPREPFGIGPLEAMASGTPLVAPDSGGVTTYANAANAWLSPPSGAAFARAIRSIAADAGERERRVRAALETASACSWDSAASRYFEIYETIRTIGPGLASEHSVPPLFFSTPGGFWGRETRLHNKFI